MEPKRKHGAKPKSVMTRNEFKNSTCEITLEDEKSILKNLELDNDSFIKEQNNKAIKDKFYGKRLSFLLNLYNKSIVNLSLSIGYSSNYLHNAINNKVNNKITKGFLSKLSFYFEIDEEFFIKDEVNIILTEQNKVKYVKH